MYHFVSEQTPELRLSDNVLISSHTTQYLKSFQLEAVRFLHDRLSKQEFCIFNDENGLGKCASIVALLNGLGATKKTLIVLQNDDHLLAGWQFHLGVLTDLPVCVIKDVNNSTESAHSVYLSKWSVLRSIGDLSKLKFDYVIVDHRGFTLNNNFCTSMLLKQFERKVNIVISSVDITSDVKLLYNVLRLGGCLEHQYKTFQSFERKFHLPDVKEVLSKRVDLEEYYKQRGVLGEYIKDFRLRRYRHQFESYLPLVTPEQFKINLSLWLGENNSNSTISQTTIESSTEALSTGGTDEIFECLMKIKQEREWTQQEKPEKMSVSESSDEAIGMEPLVLEMSDSETEEVVEENVRVAKSTPTMSSTDVVLLSSDDCEIVTPPTTPPSLSRVPTTSPATKTKRKYTKRSLAAKSVDLTDSETEEPTNSQRKTRKLNIRLSRVTLTQNTQEEVTSNSKKSLEPVTKSSPKKSPVLKAPLKPAPVASKQSQEPTTLLKAAQATKPRPVDTKIVSELTTKKSPEKTTPSKTTQRTKSPIACNKSPELTTKKTQEKKTPLKPTAVKKPSPVTAKKTTEQQKNAASVSTDQLTPKRSSQVTKPASKKSQEQRTPLESEEPLVSIKKTHEQKTPSRTTHVGNPASKKTPLKTALKTIASPATSKNTPEQKKKLSSPEPITPKQDKLVTPKSEPKSKRSHLRDMNSDEVVMRQTRGMQRLTRSADSRMHSKYMAPLKALEFEKKVAPKVKRRLDVNRTPKTSKRRNEEEAVKLEAALTPKKSTATATTEEEPKVKKGRGRPKNKLSNDLSKPSSSKKKKEDVSAVVATPELLSSGSISSNYSYMQCAQKLPDNLTELESFSEFRIPQAPQATPSMLPVTLNFFSDSEVVVVPNSNPKPDVVVINSSNDECSQQSTTQSRRTRALKRKVSSSSKEQSQPSTSSFGMLLAQQRNGVNKSPDIFSNCSDLSQITLAQHLPSTSPFEGFKIFGSEVKQLQQQHAKVQQLTMPKKNRERSCLDLLENMFDTQKTKGKESGISLLPNLPSPEKQLPPRRFTLLDDDIFEITNNGEFGSRLRLNSTGNVSPVHQQQQPQQLLQQRNKITKYLIGSGCTPEDAGQRTQSSQAQRKSPKSIKSTQSTKLTRWFNSATASGSSQSAPSTPVVPAEKANAARVARSGGPTKRKQLNLFK
ncbi:protein suppressor of underreplication [Drosophila innubila]|uniref:protein suppressor of underreplication n=1 Tax=Drosophila innubila TaxID=198719 RepID=UPI00148C6E51|nr:protein suppressor of underreplication [Drosophila innubila]